MGNCAAEHRCGVGHGCRMLRHAAGGAQSSGENLRGCLGLDLYELGFVVRLRSWRFPAGSAGAAGAQAIHYAADFYRTGYEVIHFYRAGHFIFLIQCRPLLMAQPHCEQSGVPPKTQGSTRVSRSAE